MPQKTSAQFTAIRAHLKVDRRTLAIEDKMVEVLRGQNHTDGLTSYVAVESSFSDLAKETVFGDVGLIVAGFAIVFVYVVLMLGKFDLVETRVSLALTQEEA